MKTIELTIHVGEALQELLIAELSELDFDGFEQHDDYLKAFVAAPRWDDVKRQQVETWLAVSGVAAPVEERVIEPENWNARWEESMQPVAVGRFLIKPTWHRVAPEYADRILLEIDPKMSFGTGYHASTRLVLRFLPEVVRGGETVLDAGTGTGILAIAALKLGAARAVAFDIDEWAQVNAVENFYLNEVAERVTFREGSLDVVPEDDFDLVLANIHRSVLVEMLPAFRARLRPGGRIVLSGLLLHQDRTIMLDAVARTGMEVVREEDEGEWWAAVLQAPAA